MPVLEEVQRANILSSLFDNYTGPAFAIELWDGWTWSTPANAKPQCTIAIYDPSAFELLLANPTEVSLGEAFIRGDIDVKGDIFSVFSVGEHVFNRPDSMRRQLWQRAVAAFIGIRNAVSRGRKHSPARDRSAIQFHYDQPFEFYNAWLGKSLTYSCAYFKSADEELDNAQENKIDLICRKLRIQPFEQFLDIGCGWGSLILHAAKNYGAYAEGITLSKEQARVAESRIQKGQLTQSCKAKLKDYRTLADVTVPFDKVASVGMFEHVGLKNLPQYFATVWRAMKPGGVFLNHGIARAHHSPARRSSFIDRYVFPDGELVTLSQALTAAEAAGFEVRDVENLREHYELTLRHWVQNLQSCADVVLELVPETTYRVWLLYMAGCAAAFKRGEIAVYQTLLSRPDHGESRLPLTREDWYLPEVSNEA